MVHVIDNLYIDIEPDGRGYTLCEKKKSINKKENKEVDVYPAIGYYGELDLCLNHAYKYLFGQKMKDKDMEVKDMFEVFFAEHDRFKDLLSEITARLGL